MNRAIVSFGILAVLTALVEVTIPDAPDGAVIVVTLVVSWQLGGLVLRSWRRRVNDRL